MKLVDNYEAVLKHSWSVRGALVTAVLYAALIVWPGLQEAMPLWAFAAGALVLSLALIPARLLEQKELHTEVV
jgi:hypothetical protein